MNQFAILFDGRVPMGGLVSNSLITESLELPKLGVELFGAVTNNFQLSKGQLTAQVGGDYGLSENLTFTFGVPDGRFSASPRAGIHLGFAYDFK